MFLKFNSFKNMVYSWVQYYKDKDIQKNVAYLCSKCIEAYNRSSYVKRSINQITQVHDKREFVNLETLFLNAQNKQNYFSQRYMLQTGQTIWSMHTKVLISN